MNTKQAFEKHYAKFQKNSIVKSILLGSIVGLAVAVVLSAFFWFYGVKAFWVSIPVFLAVAAGMTVLFTKTVFKPKANEMARKLDSLGLEERLITMTELENDDSFIASLQRDDAKQKSSTLNSKLIKFAVSVPLCVGVAFALLLSGGMTTVNALSSAGVIRSGKQIIEDINTVPDVYYNVYYAIEGGGVILGEDAQVLKKGESGSAVMAVADYGYAFVRWSDGYTEPYRKDVNVQGDKIYTAIFEPDTNILEGSEYEDRGDCPYDPEDGGEGGKKKKPSKNEDPDDRPMPDDSKSVSDNAGSTVIDGATDYGGKIYTEALKDATEQTNGNPNYDGDSQEIISDYITGIKK